MTVHKSIGSAIEKSKINSSVAYIPLLVVEVMDRSTRVITERIRIARNTEDVMHRGNVYTAGGFDFEIQETEGEMPSVSITTTDWTGELQQRIDSYGGGVGFRVRLRAVWSDDLNATPELDELFYVLSTTVEGFQISFTLGVSNPLRARFPRRLQFRDACPWTFKGPECGYNGAAGSCDKTLNGPNGCAVKGNNLRFGGFPGLQKVL